MKNENKGYLIQNASGEVIYAFGAKDDQEALRTALEHMGEEEPWTLTNVRLIQRPIVHEHITVYVNNRKQKEHTEAQEVLQQIQKQAGSKASIIADLNPADLNGIGAHTNG